MLLHRLSQMGTRSSSLSGGIYPRIRLHFFDLGTQFWVRILNQIRLTQPEPPMGAFDST